MPATTNAPVDGKMIGIQAGASRRIQVVSPGAASNSLSPNWCSAWSNADTGRTAGALDTARLCVERPGRLAGRSSGGVGGGPVQVTVGGNNLGSQSLATPPSVAEYPRLGTTFN